MSFSLAEVRVKSRPTPQQDLKSGWGSRSPKQSFNVGNPQPKADVGGVSQQHERHLRADIAYLRSLPLSCIWSGDQ